MNAEERGAVFRECERFLRGHGPVRPREVLAGLAEEVGDERADMYGRGELIEGFEARVAELLGKPAAVFMPSGTMAQAIALRIWADRSGRSTVAFHPTSHLELHEQRGYEHLHGLRARLVGDRYRPLAREDLDGVAEPVAALLLELPQREIGGHLPAWEELEAQVRWARERGAAVHLDGARLWETAPFYGRPYADIAALFDTVYVSFYKILGAVAGAALAGDEDTIAEARVWLRRQGGNLVAMYPMVLSARAGLRDRLPRIAGYCERARRVARAFAALPGVRVTPDPPHTNMLHAFFPCEPDRLLDASVEIARRHRVCLVSGARGCDVPGTCVTEIGIGDAAAAIPDEELARLLSELWETVGSPAAHASG